ncbi:MAG: RHS repeat-associated core domain-containing protein, partial [Candidatus Sulfotelmatobacter sp.]
MTFSAVSVTTVCFSRPHSTGKERDSESNLDNFEARYMASTLGRFMSPDPGNAGADATNPQSWNMYSYVLNNPLGFIDPTGLYCLDQNGNEMLDDSRQPLYGNEADCATNGGLWVTVDGQPNQNSSVTINGDTGEVDYSADLVGLPVNQSQPQKSYAQCVKEGGDFFSAQHGLQSLSGGRLGNGWLSSAFLGNTFSGLIQAGQDFSRLSWAGLTSGTKDATQVAVSSDAAVNAADNAAQSIPNVAVSATVAASAGIETPTIQASINATARIGGTLPIGSAARVATGALKVLGLVKTPVDATATIFA